MSSSELAQIPVFKHDSPEVEIAAVGNFRVADNRPGASEMRRSAMMDAEQRATTIAIDWKAIATQVGDL
jgi:hypothetical protein